MLYMLIVKASQNSENHRLPSESLRQAMTDYNQKLVEAGVRVMAKGLHPTDGATRIYFNSQSEISKIEDGPFENPEEIIAGFIIIEVASKAEAMKWAMQMPDPQGFGEGQIELRQIFE